MMKKFTLVLCLMIFLPNIVFSKSVEIYMVNELDEYRGYCVDIKGYKLNAKINIELQAHTCYSYQGKVAVDQGFDPVKLKKNVFFLPGFDVCMEAESLSASALLLLRKCNSNILQQFKLDKTGRIRTSNESTLCVTIGQEESQKGGGGSPVHLKRKLTLESCSTTLEAYQIWGTRASNSP